MKKGDGQIWPSSSEVLTLIFIYFYFFFGLFFLLSCVWPLVKLSTLCSTEEDGERSGAVLGTKRFPRNPERFPNGGCELDSFPCRENQGKWGVNEAERILCFHCGDYSTQTAAAVHISSLIPILSSVEILSVHATTRECVLQESCSPCPCPGFPFLVLKSQLFSSENFNDLLIILAKVGFCVKYILYYNPWNQPVFIKFSKI